MRNCIRRGPSSRRIHKQAFFLCIEEDSLYLRENRVLLINPDIHEGFTPDERTLPYGSDTGRNGDAGQGCAPAESPFPDGIDSVGNDDLG
jgi:hypothetical protein